MKEVAVRSQRGALVPIDDVSESVIIGLSGQEMMAKIWKPRNLKHNKWAHKLFSLVAENHPTLRTIDAVKMHLKLRLGLFDPVATKSGKVVYVMRSTSFATMDEIEFREFMEQAIRVVCEEMLPGIEQDDVALEIMRYLA